MRSRLLRPTREVAPITPAFVIRHTNQGVDFNIAATSRSVMRASVLYSSRSIAGSFPASEPAKAKGRAGSSTECSAAWTLGSPRTGSGPTSRTVRRAAQEPLTHRSDRLAMCSGSVLRPAQVPPIAGSSCTLSSQVRICNIAYNPPEERERYRREAPMPRPKLFDIEVKTGLTDAMHARLRELAEADSTTVSDLIRDAIKRYLQERF